MEQQNILLQNKIQFLQEKLKEHSLRLYQTKEALVHANIQILCLSSDYKTLQDRYNWINAHNILGIPENAEPHLIKKVYTKLVMIYHPNIGSFKNDSYFQKITTAYNMLIKD